MPYYKDLIVWQKSFKLSVKIYRITEKFPKHELYGLTSQMRRSAVSIPSNISEGNSRGHKLEYLQFLRVSLGSASELETQLMIAKELKYLTIDDFEYTNGLLMEVQRLVGGLIKSLRE